MGTDIVSWVERRIDGEWQVYMGEFISPISSESEPFSSRDYLLFDVLCSARKDYLVESILSPSDDLPDNLTAESVDRLDYEYGRCVTLRQLREYDYDRPYKYIGHGTLVGREDSDTIAEELGMPYFDVLFQLDKLGSRDDVRVVFYFN